MGHLSTHVLDAVTGRPADGVVVTLTDASGAELTTARTDADGRVGHLHELVTTGLYRLRFDTAGYFTATGVTGFYPEVVISFTLDDADAHYHVPLLLSPYAYSTYRGS